MNVVEILEKCCLIEITVEYCRKKLLCFFFTFRKVIQNSPNTEQFSLYVRLRRASF